MLKSDMTARNTELHNASGERKYTCMPPMYTKTNAQPWQAKEKKTCVYQVSVAPLSIDFVKLVIFVFFCSIFASGPARCLKRHCGLFPFERETKETFTSLSFLLFFFPLHYLHPELTLALVSSLSCFETIFVLP